MGDKTGIQWTDSTWNPTVGCSLKSSGCEFCYAMSTAHRFSGEGQYYEGTTRVSGGRPVWTGKILLKQAKLDQPLRWTKPRRVFVNSMSDVHHENIPLEYVAAIYGIMLASPSHQFQVLTKRPERMLEFFEWLRDEAYPDTDPAGYRDVLCAYAAHYLGDGSDSDFKEQHLQLLNRCPEEWPASNIWLGVSTEDQKAADERIPVLQKVPAVVRFLSMEPLIGPVNLTNLDGIHWTIVGGESGPGHRPCKQEWVEAILTACQDAGVPFFFKQKGETWARECGTESKKGGDIEDFPLHLQVREFPQELSNGT